MSGVKGNIGALAQLHAKLLRLPGMSDQIAADAAPGLSSIAASDFASERTPDGAGWPARARKHGLVRSGALRDAATRYSAVGGRRLRSGSLPRYARYQNPRLFLPAQRKLPESYRAAVRVSLERVVRRILEGGA